MRYTLVMKGIYKITNTANGRYYIGSSVNIHKRWIAHRFKLKKGTHHCKELQSDYNLHGGKSFIFEVIEETEMLQEKEQLLFNSLPHSVLYNTVYSAYALRGEDHPMYGRTHTEEARKKIKDHRKKQVISHSIETRRKIGDSNRGKIHSAESIEKMRASKAKNKKPAWNKGLTIEDERVKKYIKKITLNLNEEVVIDMYKSGASINSISKELYCSWDAVKNCLKRNGIKIRTISEQKILRDKGCCV